MKNNYFLIIFLFGFVMCSQDNKIQENPKNMNELNSDNYVAVMLKNVKHYDYEPTYWLRIPTSGFFEIMVNDLPVCKYYDNEYGMGGGIPINYAILKTGKQKISYQLYPHDEISFTERDKIIINVIELDNKGNMNISDEKTIFEYQTKQGEIPIGETYYEGRFEFEAEVPYENKGWSEGQDLRKFDSKELEKAVLAFYQTVWDIYNDKSKVDSIYPKIEKKDTELVIAHYQNKEEIENNLKVYQRPYTNPTYEMQPLENFRLVIYGDGKLVALEQNSMDVRLRGELALWAKYKNEGENSINASFPNLYLYLPQGKSLEDGLEIIR
jgi:hypothetical protein